MKQSRGEAALEVFAIIAAVIIGVLIAIGLGLWWLIDQASRGNDMALVVLTILGTLTAVGFSALLVWGTISVNQRQDERVLKQQQIAMTNQAMETQKMLQMQTQAALALQRTQTEAAKTAVTQAKLPGQEAQLRQLLEEYLANGGTAVPVDDYFIVDDRAYSDLGGGL